MIKDIKSSRILSTITFSAILLLAIIFRFACINKVDGLWYDELVMFNQVNQSNLLKTIFYSLTTDVHLPLYQVMLHLWAKIFSFSDFSLRSFSAVTGVLTVCIGYFVGNAFKSKFQAFLMMFLFATNSFLIYYSQEVRMYELLAFFSALNLLFLIRLNRSKIDTLFWILSTLGLVFTYTISIIYVVIEIVAYSIYKQNFKNKGWLKSVGVFLVLVIPILVPYFFIYGKRLASFVTGFYADGSSLFVTLQNFFTPKLVGINNNPIHYFVQFVQNFSFSDFAFVVVPLVIASYFIFKAVKEDKFARLIFIISLVFVLIEVLAFIFTDFKILSRYLIIILPNLLTLIAIGAKDYKNKVSLCFILMFLLVNFSYLVYSPRASYKLGREGYLPIVNLMLENNIQDNDIVFVWNRNEILSKYLDKNVTTLSLLKDVAYKSEYVFAMQDKLEKSNADTKKELLKDYFVSRFPAENTEILMAFVISRMKPEQKIFLVTNGYFNDFSEDFYKRVSNQDEFKEFTFNNLMTIKATLDLKYICNNNLKSVGTYKNGFYVLKVWKK